MAEVTCEAGDFYENVMQIFEAFVQEAEEDLQEDVYAAADDAVSDLKEAIGKWSQLEDIDGREALTYEKGWVAYKYAMRDGHVESVAANKTAPSLTHLIEKGHELFIYGHDTGRRTKPRPHIKEAFEKSANKHFGRY